MKFLLDALRSVVDDAGPARRVDDDTEQCGLPETGLYVIFYKGDTQEVLAGKVVQIKGRSPFSKQTDGDGVAKFKPVEPDTYRVQGVLPQNMRDDYEVREAGQEVRLGQSPMLLVKARRYSTWAQFEIKNQLTEHPPQVAYELRFPLQYKPNLKGQLQDGKVRVKSTEKGQFTLKLKIILAPTWERGQVRDGVAIKLRAQAPGFDDETEATFMIHDADAMDGAALDSVTAKVADGALEAEWTPAADKLLKAASGAVRFSVTIDAARATSVPVPAEVEQEYQLQDQGGAEVNTDVVLHFDGAVRKAVTTVGGKAKAVVAAGARLVRVEVADVDHLQMELEQQ